MKQFKKGDVAYVSVPFTVYVDGFVQKVIIEQVRHGGDAFYCKGFFTEEYEAGRVFETIEDAARHYAKSLSSIIAATEAHLTKLRNDSTNLSTSGAFPYRER